MTGPYAALALLAIIAWPVTAQQAATSQPPIPPTQPCPAPKPTDTHGVGLNTNTSKPAGIFNKFRQRIEDKTGLELPSADDLKKRGKKAVEKPCQSPNASPAPAPTPIPVTPASQAKPAVEYICPPKATLIPGHNWCLLPDHSTVDAIPLPPQAKQ